MMKKKITAVADLMMTDDEQNGTAAADLMMTDDCCSGRESTVHPIHSFPRK